MALPRKHNLEQLKKLRLITKNNDIGDKVKDNNKKYPNGYSIDNPFDRKIDTYESFIKIDNKLKVNESITFEEKALIIWENYYIDNFDFINENQDDINVIVEDIINKNDYTENIESMKDDFFNIVSNHMDVEFVGESVHNSGMGPTNNPLFGTPTIRQSLTTSISTNSFQIGKYINVGKIKGFLDSIDNKYLYLSTEGVNKEKVLIKDYIKELSKSKEINEKSGLYSEFWDKLKPKEEEKPYYPNEIDVMERDEELDQDIEITDDDYEEEMSEVEDVISDNIRRYPTPRRYSPRRLNKKTQEMPNNIPYEMPTKRKSMLYNSDNVQENIYIHDDKKVMCNDCGQMIMDDYKSKVSHIYNKHMNKPEMDGSVPHKEYTTTITSWPQGGKQTQKLITKYFYKG